MIVIGNIAVGGTGKTPLVIALVSALKHAGLHPGIISRGYGSAAPHYPFLVTARSSVIASGDEPLLIARRCQCPVMIDRDRTSALDALLKTDPAINVVISDDVMADKTCNARQGIALAQCTFHLLGDFH